MATPTGKVNFCCISGKTRVTDDEGKPIVLDTHGFKDAWNSSYMRNIRKRMINGEPVKGCEACYKQEKVGKKSSRLNNNSEWLSKLGHAEIERRVELSKKNDYHVKDPAVYLDLRLGNLCNLKCRMCNPYNSVQIQKEWQALDKKTNNAYSEFWKKYGLVNGGCSEWYESDVFWNSVEEFIPRLKKIYMTGGEPTLIEGNYRFLNKCRELGFAKDIELFFNINFTNLKERFIEQINQFKSTSINASFDGYGAINDYIRSQSKWTICEKNFRTLAMETHKNVELGISPVVQVYNVLEMSKILQFVEDIKLEYNRPIVIDFISCHHPNFLDIIILPKEVKLKAIEDLKDFYKRSKTINNPGQDSFYMKNNVESLINRLNQSLDQEDPEKIRDFLRYTRILDVERNQDFREVCPDLCQMLEGAGYVLQEETKPIGEQPAHLH